MASRARSTRGDSATTSTARSNASRRGSGVARRSRGSRPSACRSCCSTSRSPIWTTGASRGCATRSQVRGRTGAPFSWPRMRTTSSTIFPGHGSRSRLGRRPPLERAWPHRSRGRARAPRRAAAARRDRRGRHVHQRPRASREPGRRSGRGARCGRRVCFVLARARVRNDPRHDALVRPRARGRCARGTRRSSRWARRPLRRQGPRVVHRARTGRRHRRHPLARAARPSTRAAVPSGRRRRARRDRAATGRRGQRGARAPSARARRARPDPRAARPRATARRGLTGRQRGHQRRCGRSAFVGRTALRVRGCVLGVGPYHRSGGYRVMETTISRGTPMLRIRPWLGIAAAASFVVASVMALFWAPTDAVQGDVYRILYVHVPLAWLAFLAFVIVFLASVGWLWTKNPLFDAIAVSSAEIGVLFTGLFLVAGSIWAKPTWGVWWTWEPRLVTTAIMFVMYVGYLLLRGLSTDFSRRAARAPGAAVDNLILINLSAAPRDALMAGRLPRRGKAAPRSP